MDGEIKKYFIDTAKRQGVSFVILVLVVWYFYDEIKEMKRDFKVCNDNLIMLYSTNTEKMQELILRNTEAFERIEKIIDNKKK